MHRTGTHQSCTACLLLHPANMTLLTMALYRAGSHFPLLIRSATTLTSLTTVASEIKSETMPVVNGFDTIEPVRKQSAVLPPQPAREQCAVLPPLPAREQSAVLPPQPVEHPA